MRDGPAAEPAHRRGGPRFESVLGGLWVLRSPRVEASPKVFEIEVARVTTVIIVGNRDSYTFGTMCMFDSCMCLGVCASLVVWSLTLLLDDPVSDSLLALVLAWGTGCSPGVKVSDIQQVVQHAEP